MYTQLWPDVMRLSVRHSQSFQPVRLIYQQLSEFAFIYQKELHSQPQASDRQSPSWEVIQSAVIQGVTEPASSSAVIQAYQLAIQSEQTHVSQNFIFGWMTAAMLADLPTYGKTWWMHFLAQTT